MKEIALSQGLVAIVDDQDFEWLSEWKWCVLKRANCQHAVRRAPDRYVYMHREIVNAKSGEEVDHANLNGLDNTRSNLRKASRGNNMHNVGKRKGEATSRFKGVCWSKRDRLWVAQSTVNYKNHRLGGFKHEIAAALAYDRFAREQHGAFARLNFQYGIG